MPISNIDDLLASGATQTQPKTPEHQEPDVVYADEDVDEVVEHEEFGDESEPEPESEPGESDSYESDEEEKPKRKGKERDVDEYGNEQEPENEVIRERLKKQAESMNRRHEAEINALRAQLQQTGASHQIQQAAKDFEYNPNESGDWQQQLASFVKQTVNSMTQETRQQQQQQQEALLQREFESKLVSGMEKFHDFRDVVGAHEITDAMTLATRAMSDPAAFLYAAAKRQPEELQRIAKIRDPYAQMTEMGKLEERMRRNKPTTKAPRPLGRISEDTGTPIPKKKESNDRSGDDLLASADAKRLAQVKTRLKNNR